MMESLYDECHRLFSYDAETGLLTRKVAILLSNSKPHNKPNCKVGDVVGTNNDQGYLLTRVRGKYYRLHRIIWLMTNGSLPKKWLDHINGNKADNRLANLRECNQSENLCNKGKNANNTSGYKGVNFCESSLINPYRAQITINGKIKHLGLFRTPELAHQAYSEKAKELHGEFARVV